MPRSLCLLALLLVPAFAPAAAPPLPSATAHGDRLRDAYFRLQARKLADDALADVKSKEDWQKKQPEMRRQFLDMLGLWPLPKRTDLKATITGTVVTKTYVVENLHFQSVPGLYVTANLYLPKKVTAPCPAVLYVCGHGAHVIENVAYGNKVTYQHHPTWFAENGYVCLVVDTLQLGEIPGLHHGTSRFGMWWWLSLGYTPAGIECWNGMRAIDYLVSRKEVDPKRLGVTGRSGGGATSWWVGAADERVKCIVPVAGIADLLAHVSEGYPGSLRDGVVAGHCDCMYFNNTYRWDYTQVIALCAPRPVLLGNSDADNIFPVPGYRRMTDRVKKLYEILGEKEKLALLETKGPHKDTPELRLGAFQWMNRWLKDDTKAVKDTQSERLLAQQLKVFDRAPKDSINDVIHERFRRPATLEIPEADEVAKRWWEGKAPQLKAALAERVFRGWPEKAPAKACSLAADVKHQGVRLRAFDFVSEEAVPLRLWLLQHEKVPTPGEIIVSVVDEAGWTEWVKDLGPTFEGALHGGGNPAPRPYPAWDEARFDQHRRVMEQKKLAYAVVAPRGVGPTRWSDKSRFDGRAVGHQIKRRFYLLGQTWEGQQVWDVRRAVASLREVKGLSDVPLTLQGRGEMGVIALYAAIFEDKVAGVELWQPPASHKEGPTFLNVLTVLDVPQAAALVLPRKVRVQVKDDEQARAWQWTARLQKATGGEGLKVRVVGD